MPEPRDMNRDSRASLALEGRGEWYADRVDGHSTPVPAAPAPLVEEDWSRVVGMVPMDLEGSVRDTKALQRRREVRTGSDLLRMALAYALCEWSLPMVAAWACLKGLADLSATALRNRLRAARVWMGSLVAACVIQNRRELAAYSVRVRLVDATTIPSPGKDGKPWRLHLSFDLGRMLIDGAELTDVHGGETLARHPTAPGDVEVSDGGYCRRSDIGSVLSRGGQLVMRVNWQTLPMRDQFGRPVDLMSWLQQVPQAEPGEQEVVVETPGGVYRLRLIARRLSQEAADRARHRLRRQAARKGRTLDHRSLEAAGFIILVTTLDRPRWSAKAVLALYRLRWQVELLFKRLKGVLRLDGLRAKDSDLAQVYILGNLLAAMLADRLGRSAPVESAQWFVCLERPVSPWRWLVWWTEALRSAIRGAMSLSDLLAALPRLRRYFCDSPRRRRQHSAFARCLAQFLGGPPTTSKGGGHVNQSLLLPAYA